MEHRDLKVHEIISDVKQNNFTSFEEDFNSLFAWITNYTAFRFSSLDRPTCEAIAQETLFRLLRFANQYRGISEKEARSWLIKIAHNLAIATAKQEKKFTDLDAVDFRPDISGFDELNERLTQINWECLRHVFTDREWQVLNLLLQGYNNVSIAEALDLTKSRISQITGKIEDKIRNCLGSSNND